MEGTPACAVHAALVQPLVLGGTGAQVVAASAFAASSPASDGFALGFEAEHAPSAHKNIRTNGQLKPNKQNFILIIVAKIETACDSLVYAAQREALHQLTKQRTVVANYVNAADM
jgi:hypothetical protein